jgi:hypothetical protein
MARYVMSNRRAGKFRKEQKLASRDALASTLSQLSAGIDVVHDREPEEETARRVVVFEATPGEIEAKSKQLPMSEDVLIEAEIQHFHEPAYPADFAGLGRRSFDHLPPVGDGEGLEVEVRGDGSPLAGAEVLLFLRGLGGMQNKLRQTTGDDGRVEFLFSAFWEPSALLVTPVGDFWPVVARGPAGSEVIDCPPLPRTGPAAWAPSPSRRGSARGSASGSPTPAPAPTPASNT